MDNFPKIPDEEFKSRIQKFKEKMSENNLDLAVVFSNLLDPSAVRYFTDVSPINESSALVIPLEGKPIMCSGQACHKWSEFKSKVDEVRIFPEVGEVSGVEYNIKGQYDFRELFLELKDRYKIKKIGIIGDLIFPHEIYKKLEEVFPGIPKISAEKLMYELRMQKSDNEIACMRKAGQIISETFRDIAVGLKPGNTELDIQAGIESKILRLGAEAYCLSFSPMIPSGPEHSNLCMNRNTLRKIKEGEIVDLQAGALYEGYNAVICTPVVLGKIPNDIIKAVQVANEAKDILVDSMRPDVSSKELYKIYSNFLDDKDYSQFSPYGSVHSIGMLECETPFFSPKKDVFLLENMTVCIDAYFKDLPWGGFRIEDTYLITKKGSELLTDFNSDFIKDNF